MPEQGKFVCYCCFEDPGLVEFIKENAESEECSYCPQCGQGANCCTNRRRISALHRVPIPRVQPGGGRNGMGGWRVVWPILVREELATDVLGLEFPQGNEDQLLPDLFGEDYEQDWCEADPYGLNNQERAESSWAYFREVVMHRRRFFFLLDQGNPYERSAYDPGRDS